MDKIQVGDVVKTNFQNRQSYEWEDHLGIVMVISGNIWVEVKIVPKPEWLHYDTMTFHVTTLHKV